MITPLYHQVSTELDALFAAGGLNLDHEELHTSSGIDWEMYMVTY